MKKFRDAEGLVHFYDRWRTGPDENDDITYCGVWLQFDEGPAPEPAVPTCVFCLGGLRRA